jgi:spore germination protein KC
VLFRSIDLNMDTTVAIDEINGKENFIDEDGRKKLEKNTETILKNRIDTFISKIQSEYDADIFGFGAKLREDKFQAWKRVSNNWEKTFNAIKVNVIAKVHIRNSAMLSKPLEER